MVAHTKCWVVNLGSGGVRNDACQGVVSGRGCTKLGHTGGKLVEAGARCGGGKRGTTHTNPNVGSVAQVTAGGIHKLTSGGWGGV